jgi:hypothetical protein
MLLQALPLLPARLLPTFSLHVPSRSARRLRSVASPCSQADLITFRGGFCRSGDSRFGNPRVRREDFRGQVRASAGSAMAGASSSPPPMYRANVGVCLINDENKVSVLIEAFSDLVSAHGI